MDSKAQLNTFIGRYSPEVAADARRALAFLENRMPAATRLVYDNYNALVVGFGPSEKSSQAILSIALYPRYVRLFFLRGVDLPDPSGLLEGDGSQVRSIKLRPISILEAAEVGALIDSAVGDSFTAPPEESGKLIIKSISARHRPREPCS